MSDPYRELDLSLSKARSRSIEALREELAKERNCLFSALPGMRKSSGTPEAAADVDVQLTVLTAREELYGQIGEWCEQQGLEYLIVPSLTRSCPSAKGKFGQDLAEEFISAYSRGIPSRMLHDHEETPIGHPVPCADGMECPYHREVEMLNPDSYDVLIGHYTHAYVEKYIEDRIVVVDEFPESAYVTTIDEELASSVSTWFQQQEDLPDARFADILEHRRDAGFRQTLADWFDENGVTPDPSSAGESELVHASTPLAVFTLLHAKQLGNGWERVEIDEDTIGVYDGRSSAVHLLRRPDLSPAKKVLALDGTPTHALWEMVLGVDLEYLQILTERERRAYIWNALGHRIYQTTDATKPYSSGNYVNLQQDHALVDAVRRRSGQAPALISSKKAIEGGGTNQDASYTSAGLLEKVSACEHRGNLIGSNQFAREHVGIVTGSAHYGDDYIKRWGAFAGEAVDPSRYEDKPGSPREYGEFGEKVREHMADHGTLQEILRFGRDGQGATVFVHTSALPDWVPLAGKCEIVSTHSDGLQQVLAVAAELDEWTTAELAQRIDIGERQVRKHLKQLHADGFIDRESQGRGFVWRDTGLHKVNEHGKVDLTPVQQDTVSDEQVAELARNTINTWEFRNTAPNSIYSVDKAIHPPQAESYLLPSG